MRNIDELIQTVQLKYNRQVYALNLFNSISNAFAELQSKLVFLPKITEDNHISISDSKISATIGDVDAELTCEFGNVPKIKVVKNENNIFIIKPENPDRASLGTNTYDNEELVDKLIGILFLNKPQ
ncbi:hypothetical protein CJ467_14610 [Bacillus velezensis]|uniref:hypothetical protein n=1 Tax=Bacillus velezensis TaxID=492670 RepID=UPI000BA6E11D|nr:hypothetical protein [Bacillus velezensis]PAK29626.1 hypothetical protein CJ467_14610 [Bacillus velezensis]